MFVCFSVVCFLCCSCARMFADAALLTSNKKAEKKGDSTSPITRVVRVERNRGGRVYKIVESEHNPLRPTVEYGDDADRLIAFTPRPPPPPPPPRPRTRKRPWQAEHTNTESIVS